MDELLKVAISQGLGYGLFVALLIYTLKTTGERETRYQNLLEELTKKFNIVDEIRENVKEIRSNIGGKI